jgi:hypothetical protein
MRIILVHGFNASPEMNFHPWLAAQLRAKGFEVVVPALPLKSGEELDLPTVMKAMEEQVGFLKPDDILLGHSLGALIILQYMEAVEMLETPRAVIMVGAPFKVSKPELRRLFFVDLDADVAMWKAKEFYVVHSKDDALVPFEHGQKLAAFLKAKLIETETDGHFMDAEYPVLLKTIEKIATTPFEFAPGMSLPDDYANKAWADRLAPASSQRPDWMT